MANIYIPTNLRVESLLTNKVTVTWDFSDPGNTKNYTFKAYVSLVLPNPFPGPPVVTSPRQSIEINNPFGTFNYYVTISSFDNTTGEESAQSAPLFISEEHTAEGVGGVVAKSTTGVPKFIQTDETGKLVTSIVIAPGSGISTEAKQDDAIDILEQIRDKPLIGGEEFNEFWSSLVNPAFMTSVFSLAVPGAPSTTIYYLSGIYITGQGPCLIELKRGATKVWEGRIGDVVPNEQALFINGGIKGDPGQIFYLFITQDHLTPLRFAGNLFGFKR